MQTLTKILPPPPNLQSLTHTNKLIILFHTTQCPPLVIKIHDSQQFSSSAEIVKLHFQNKRKKQMVNISYQISIFNVLQVFKTSREKGLDG